MKNSKGVNNNNNNNNNNNSFSNNTIQQLKDYIDKHEGGLITAIRNDTENTMDNRMTITSNEKLDDNCMGVLNNKQTTAHSRKPGRG